MKNFSNINTPKGKQDEQWMVFDFQETRTGSCRYKIYWVSSFGRTAVSYSYKDSIKKLPQYGTSHKDPNKQYLAFSKNDLSCKYVHQAVASMFVPNPNPDKYTVVNHKDGNKMNNHHTNLEWCTQRQNIWHAKGVENYFDYV